MKITGRRKGKTLRHEGRKILTHPALVEAATILMIHADGSMKLH